ncbi:HAMP domain-containing histidine kinase [Nocardioides sp. KIGAM211]|uniref:histidine kinase n=1 Tax=Nocardioides luti TaxID=2761101 RepID=A0A7X0REK8_9ACTN|nr:HAMP domain-containing histidine kinase [Nocardioides luti]MBB6626857.1 HAMP domain-containing histidine kinase [Nocardioides luti]
MRERLTFSFILLTVLLLLAAGVVRSYTLRDLIRERESAHVHQEVVLIQEIVADRQRSGGSIDEAFLASLVGGDSRLEYAPEGSTSTVVRGSSYDGTDDPSEDLSATSEVYGGTVTVSQSPEVVKDILTRDVGSLVVLFLLIAIVAGLIGFLISRALSAPFRQLAVAAAALGRGRFDLDLPRSRIPEARALSQALATSAGQLEDRLRRERDFAEQASHMLRSPLTGLRLELEDLTLRDDIPEDAKLGARRGMGSVDEMNAVAGELVQLSRSGSLVEGAEMPLVELATQLAQRWADRLSARDRVLTASAEGDLTLTYTPGPVEHVLDLVLAEVVRRGTGAVRIVFQGQDGGHLRVKVSADGRPAGKSRGAGPGTAVELEPRLDQARTVVEALGGRISGDDPARGLEVLLPRR